MRAATAWELAGWDAVETRARLQAREVSAREVTEAAIMRAEAATVLNAIVTCTFERALRRAEVATGPLAGVPTFYKDLMQLEGVRTAWGSAATGTFISRRSDPTAKRFEATGLVTLGKSATPELGLTATTEPTHFGPTRNPWDLSRTAGGSSGGAAALVASGVVPLAPGSDGGGSIRIPASCCGLVGLKPSRGRLDMEGSNLLPVNVAVHGVLTRSVRDTVAFWSALEAQRPSTRPRLSEVPPSTRRLRIGWFDDSPLGTLVDPEVRQATRETADALAGLGHQVEHIACPFPRQTVLDFLHCWGFVAFIQARTGRLMLHRGFDAAKLEPWTRAFASAFQASPFQALAAMARLRRWARGWNQSLGAFDLWLSPTLAQLPAPLGHLRTDVPFDEARTRLSTFTPFSALLNVAGAPGLSLPLARTADGLPIGLQLIARVDDEATLLRLGFELEAALPWPRWARVTA